ncbi:MAG: hypothetical protein Q8R82_08805 [Hyphomonadaceae bacterium]|nr:hypothetical protein [Hyphomonadaceae bacterium]
MRVISAVVFTMLLAAPAYAQRDAVSADLSPEAAAGVFRSAVADVCVPAVLGNGVSALSSAQRGMLRPTQDAETRKQAGASPDETVWDVMDGKGVVTVREKAGRCVVSVYGPPAAATIQTVAQALVGPPGFQRLAQPVIAANGLGQTLQFSYDGRAVVAQLTGSEPGMAGHQSRFSVVTATVFRAQ